MRIIIRISAIIFFLILIPDRTWANTDSSSLQRTEQFFKASGQEIYPGTSDSFYNVIKNKYQVVEKISFQTYDSIYSEVESIAFTIQYDSIRRIFLGRWSIISTGKIIQTGEFDINRFANGVFKYQLNKDTSICNYLNGLKTGIQYYRNAELTYQTSFLSDLKDGLEIVYKNNLCTSVANYEKGKLNGPALMFVTDDQNRVYLYKKTIYKSGKVANGFNYSYHPNGRVLAKRRYWNGNVIGKVKIYNEDGKLFKKVDNASCIYF